MITRKKEKKKKKNRRSNHFGRGLLLQPRRLPRPQSYIYEFSVLCAT